VQVHELLWRSVQKIHCKFVVLPDKKAELFFGMKLASRGSLRKAPDVLTWVISLTNLQARGGESDPLSVVKSWNEDSAKHDRVQGAKAVGVQNVLLLPDHLRDIILASVSKNGYARHKLTVHKNVCCLV
jgi:hypothetical protein